MLDSPTRGPRSLNVYAIVEDSGTQIKVAEGDLIDIDIRELDDKATSITFDRVLAVQDGDGPATLGLRRRHDRHR